MTVGGDATRIETGTGEITFLTPAAYAARFPGIPPNPAAIAPYLAALSIDVEDRAATQSYLGAHDIPHNVLSGGSLCIAPEEASGTLLEFV